MGYYGFMVVFSFISCGSMDSEDLKYLSDIFINRISELVVYLQCLLHTHLIALYVGLVYFNPLSTILVN